jgi:hypothetical protein
VTRRNVNPGPIFIGYRWPHPICRWPVARG